MFLPHNDSNNKPRRDAARKTKWTLRGIVNLSVDDRFFEKFFLDIAKLD
jgi:hypothetical protein